jgi:hypothetical protein
MSDSVAGKTKAYSVTGRTDTPKGEGGRVWYTSRMKRRDVLKAAALGASISIAFSQPSIRSEKTASGIAYDVQGSGPAVVLISTVKA